MMVVICLKRIDKGSKWLVHHDVHSIQLLVGRLIKEKEREKRVRIDRVKKKIENKDSKGKQCV